MTEPGAPPPAAGGPASPDPDGGDDRAGWIRQLAAIGSVGMVFPVAIAIGFLGGRWLDARLGTDPWLSLAGFALGVVAALRNLLQSVERLDESEEEARRREGGTRHDDPRTPGPGS